jgi:DNA-binding transcriptional ArsR family regulator
MSSSLVTFGRALGDPSRVAMLLELFDQPGATLGVLARAAGVAASTASEHLDQLEDAGLITRTRTGRTISVHFANESAAAMIEQLLAFDPDTISLRPTTKIGRLRCARTCYDHLAGRLGVNLSDLLINVAVLDANFAPTPLAPRWFQENLELDFASLQSNPSKRPLVRSCLDWTEQRPHIAGLLGTDCSTRSTATVGSAKIKLTEAYESLASAKARSQHSTCPPKPFSPNPLNHLKHNLRA